MRVFHQRSESISSTLALRLPNLTQQTVHNAPSAWDERNGGPIPLISWCGTCAQTEPLILLTDSLWLSHAVDCLQFCDGLSLHTELWNLVEGHCCDYSDNLLTGNPWSRNVAVRKTWQTYSFVPQAAALPVSHADDAETVHMVAHTRSYLLHHNWKADKPIAPWLSQHTQTNTDQITPPQGCGAVLERCLPRGADIL